MAQLVIDSNRQEPSRVIFPPREQARQCRCETADDETQSHSQVSATRPHCRAPPCWPRLTDTLVMGQCIQNIVTNGQYRYYLHQRFQCRFSRYINIILATSEKSYFLTYNHTLPDF